MGRLCNLAALSGPLFLSTVISVLDPEILKPEVAELSLITIEVSGRLLL